VGEQPRARDGVFIQDQWTRGKLTLQGASLRSVGRRFQQTEGPALPPVSPIVIPETRGVDSYKI
jgi:hypothetical protein